MNSLSVDSQSAVYGKNIIVIVSDTFRRDNLSIYGGDPQIAPNLNRFATESSVFERAYSCSFPTVPARADLLTGRAAFTRQGWGPLNNKWATVAELASEVGYNTMCVTDVPFLMRSGYGYDRGFTDYIWIRGQPDRMHPESSEDVRRGWRQEKDHFAPRTMTSAAEWLERNGSSSGNPFLLFVDTWDPHEPWDAPAHYVRKYRGAYDNSVIPYPPYQEVGSTDADRDALELGRAAYLGKSHMVDSWVGFLLGRLDVLGLRDDTIVIFLTDHGFYFGEHNYFGKSVGWRIGPVSEEQSAVGEMGWSPLYEEVNHIPLMIRVPGWEAKSIGGMATIPDVAATILDIVGAEGSSESISLIREDGDGLVGPRDVAVTSWPMHLPGEETQAVDAAIRRFSGFMPITVTTDRWSLLYSSERDPVELYDLEADPSQSREVSGDNPSVVREIHSKLVDFLKNAECPDGYLMPRLRVLT